MSTRKAPVRKVPVKKVPIPKIRYTTRHFTGGGEDYYMGKVFVGSKNIFDTEEGGWNSKRDAMTELGRYCKAVTELVTKQIKANGKVNLDELDNINAHAYMPHLEYS